MKVSTEIDNNFGYEKITQLVDNIPLMLRFFSIDSHQQNVICILGYNIWSCMYLYPTSKHCVCLEINAYIQIIKERTETKGTYKVRNEIETKRNEISENETKSTK